jgi:hypothetical protein
MSEERLKIIHQIKRQAEIMVIDLQKQPQRLTQKQRAENILHLAKSFLRCPECHGDGYITIEIPKPDYVNGGYIDTSQETCDVCGGDQEITELEQLL